MNSRTQRSGSKRGPSTSGSDDDDGDSFDGNGGGGGISADVAIFVDLDDGNGKTEHYMETNEKELQLLERKADLYGDGLIMVSLI